MVNSVQKSKLGIQRTLVDTSNPFYMKRDGSDFYLWTPREMAKTAILLDMFSIMAYYISTNS